MLLGRFWFANKASTAATSLLDEIHLLLLDPLSDFVIHNQLHNFFHLEGVAIDSTLNALFLFCSLDDLFFDGAFRHNSVDCHLLGLANSVRSVGGLLIHSWIPVVVIKDDCVGCN
mgnify:CR=1 FL=1